MSSPATSLIGAGVMAAGNVGLAIWTEPRTINTGEPRAIVELDAVPVGETHLFGYPTEADPAILLRLSDDEAVAFSQKCTHLGCASSTSRPRRTVGTARATEGNFDATTGAVISGPPTRPLGRIEVEVRSGTDLGVGDRAMKDPELRGRRTAAAVPVYLILLLSLQVFLVTVVVEAFLIR